MAAKSVRKEQKLPDVSLSLLRLSLKENKFTLFWKEVVEQELLKKLSWSTRCVQDTNLCSSLGGMCSEAHHKEQGL